KLANNADKVSKIESSHDIRATYYFRMTESSNDPQVIRNIAGRGHEIGYHYEDLVQTDGDLARAGAHFAEAIEYFRHFYPVTTICMHGSPRSPYDPKELWMHMSYRAYGIIGEPYLDADFNDLVYLTDTGRCWDGWRCSRRDKVPEALQNRWIAAGWVYHSTSDIIEAVGQGTFPPHVMMTSHPQRWTDAFPAWLREFVLQKTKNIIKRHLPA
ncbi:MAG: hypothetical protein J6Z12_06330, partial [Paludibacteraceae bacterium]|nr:hypothetical protein [Paludibacteraceae bacterium]